MGIIRNISQNNLVFVVDDNKVFRDILEAKVSSIPNVQVEVYATAEEALKNGNKNPKLILLDLYLDGEDKTALSGHSAIDQFGLFPSPPEIILISGEWNYELLNEYKSYRKVDHVLKSELKTQALEQKISSLLSIAPFANA